MGQVVLQSSSIIVIQIKTLRIVHRKSNFSSEADLPHVTAKYSSHEFVKMSYSL